MSTEFLRKYCLAFRGTTEDIKWGNDLCFCVAEKIFCVALMEGPFQASFKCDDEDFSTLTERDEIIPAPYTARNKWVLVKSSTALNKKEWQHFVHKSYRLILAKLPMKTQLILAIPIVNNTKN